MYNSMYEKSGESSYVYTGVTAECDSYELTITPGAIFHLRSLHTFQRLMHKIQRPFFHLLMLMELIILASFCSAEILFFYSAIKTEVYFQLTSKGVNVEAGTFLQQSASLKVDIEDNPNYKDYLNLT